MGFARVWSPAAPAAVERAGKGDFRGSALRVFAFEQGVGLDFV